MLLPPPPPACAQASEIKKFVILEPVIVWKTAELSHNIVWSSNIAVNQIGSPKIISLKGDNFTGRLEYQILKK